jgi:sialate O-acetylesterase
MTTARRRSFACACTCVLALSLVGGSATRAAAAVTANPLFADHAVLQQGAKVPVWGTADPGEAVTVEIAGQSVSTTAGADGKWLVKLRPMKAGGPFTLTISGQNKIVLGDILVGEVWVAGGQSNMERQLGLRVGQQPIDDWEKEIAAATFPQIRQFGVAQEKSLTRLASVKGRWDVCAPDAVKDFSAVGYFFGRDLHRARHVPVGIIHASWGGTPAEAWTSEAGLRPLPDFADVSQQLEVLMADPEAARRQYEARLETWFVANDAGSRAGQSWRDPTLDAGSWKTMTLPALWEDAGEPDLNGVVWFRKTFDVPAAAAGAAAELQLGMVDDVDTTWVNGVKVGATIGYNQPRKYPIPAGVLKAGRNVVAVRVLDTGGGGGIWGTEKLQLVFKDKAAAPLPPIVLSGAWRYRIGMNLNDGSWPPSGVIGDTSTPTILYNAMIAPLLPYAIRGVIWYQGEANVRREQQYRSLFPALIGDWRTAWGQDFPFLFVQIAPHHEMTPELRDAQLWTWQRTPKTAMVVTIDCGDANDIHPTHKQPVGARLALAARALAYGERIPYSGPLFQAMKVNGSMATLRFTHLAGGLVAKGGPLKGFTVAGPDKVFHAARAEIRGTTVVVTSDDVAQPVAVRYGWANVPDGNLFNKAALPASPFRTDADTPAPRPDNCAADLRAEILHNLANRPPATRPGRSAPSIQVTYRNDYGSRADALLIAIDGTPAYFQCGAPEGPGEAFAGALEPGPHHVDVIYNFGPGRVGKTPYTFEVKPRQNRSLTVIVDRDDHEHPDAHFKLNTSPAPHGEAAARK